MPVITLPDGSERIFDRSVSIAELAADIGPGLAKAALAGVVDGKQVDTSFVCDRDAACSIITDRDAEGVEIIRHSTAHLLAMAVQDLYTNVQVTIGPTIDDGFYYDFSYPDGHFSMDDFAAIEAKMQQIIDDDLPIVREELTRDQAIARFAALGEHYKVSIIEALPEGEPISVYSQGSWVDLCRGPHVPSTGKLGVFKLLRVSGAYWRGDHNNEMLQRIYGTAWRDKKQLKQYLQRIEQAQKRDHRKLGQALGLFHMQDEAPGMVFWHPKGWSLYQTIEAYMRSQQKQEGYQEIKTPQIVDMSLWEQSGHADKFSDNMFSLTSDERCFAIKPMNCPGHVQVFNQGLKSYRDLPLRLAEFGSCHRNEPSGSLHGLMRVRGFTQDDGHIFCAYEQIQQEVSRFIDFAHRVYRDFGFEDIVYRLSTRPEKRVGSDETWDEAEQALAQALNDKALPWKTLPGEGAFYGPKIEFTLHDSLGRSWQLGTIQVDFSMPARLGAQYVDSTGEKKEPVMLHRAVLGSFERFIGILIEHHAGFFPPWLSPIQVVLMTITDKQADYASELEKKLLNAGVRAVSDLRNEKIGFKIREHTMAKVPFLVVIGDKEVAQQTMSVRTYTGESLDGVTLDSLISRCQRKATDASYV